MFNICFKTRAFLESAVFKFGWNNEQWIFIFGSQ